jgi:hypothetical protein
MNALRPTLHAYFDDYYRSRTHLSLGKDSPEPRAIQPWEWDRLWRDDGAPGSDAMMWSWTINLTRGTVTDEQIDERAVEFPRIDDRLVGLPARYGVTVGIGNSCATTLNASLARSIRSVQPPRPVDLVRLYSLRPIRRRANCPAGIFLCLRPGPGRQRPGNNRCVGLPSQAPRSSKTCAARAVRIPR